MPKLCCFLHPEFNEDTARQLVDACPTCGRPYGFPLTDYPKIIGRYTVIEPLDRGFYSVAYVVRGGRFNRKKVVKLAFKATYDAFKKDFFKECEEHAKIAEGSLHIVGISDMEEVSVDFGGESFDCYIAEMDYVEGQTMSRYLESDEVVDARTVAQVAIDLFSILRELENHRVHHNDLNPGNLIVQRLPPASQRADAEDPFIRVVAIDLNSATDSSRSDPQSRRLGDLHWVVTYLHLLVRRLLPHPDQTPDLEYRLASVLEERAHQMSPEAGTQRVPLFEECVDAIRNAIRDVSSPWREAPKLRRFNDAYNAQTLAPWFVPYLMVDPEGKWLTQISIAGPQVITGMRGCGKTMLLRALQFHARATIPNGENTTAGILRQLREDGYMGLYASSTRLLDVAGSREQPLTAPYTRLLLVYALEALRAARHLKEVDPALVVASFFRQIAKAVADHIAGTDVLSNVVSEHQLEKQLLDIMIRVNRGDETYAFTAHPSAAFPALAKAVRGICPELWSNSTVFFLLDDVSTRFLNKPGIQELMSGLLFSDTLCAFKMTTENQTLEMILRSPGDIEQAREGRDYQVFDLGADVNALVRSRKRKKFVEQVLAQRAKFFAHHPPSISPGKVLGDRSLEEIAGQIASSAATSRERKQVYHGLSCLAAVCVGDIGDVISLYEIMLRKAKPGRYPIDVETQTDCYQEYSSRRLYDLHRKSSSLKDHAISFAKASNELLVKSKRESKGTDATRLRQYLKLYVRVTVGDTQRQFDQLRELIDKGVFVLEGGTHRAKTKDGNPIHQFKLTFRKLFGLANFIGLAERDRFELSGQDLIEWLDNPSNGKELLQRNLGGELEEDEQMDAEAGEIVLEQHSGGQLSLFKDEELDLPMTQSDSPTEPPVGVVERRVPRALKLDDAAIAKLGIDEIILGLGFEDRTLESAKRLVSRHTPTAVTLLQYAELGKGTEIRQLFGATAMCRTHEYLEVVRSGFPVGVANILIDITGLAKPIIFHTVRNALAVNGKVWVCRTRAEKYYPLDEDIQSVLGAESNSDNNTCLVELSKILTGEVGPYSLDPLLESNSDESRRRLLCAFSSPKHERLLALLDELAFDAVHIFTQVESTPRAKIARLAAEVVAKNFPQSSIETLESDDLWGAIVQIGRVYEAWYVEQGFNFEFGLTGSKLQAVACAVCSAALKVSQAWYVRPSEFDKHRFTSGVGETTYYEIELRPPG